jgi:hypothetical protein
MPANIPNTGQRSGDACPECGEGALACRKNSQTGGYFLGCDQFPTCSWACAPSSEDVKQARAKERGRRNRRRNWHRCQEARLELRWEAEDEMGRRDLAREWYGEPEAEWASWQDEITARQDGFASLMNQLMGGVENDER